MSVLDSERNSMIALSMLTEPGDPELGAFINEFGAKETLERVLSAHPDYRRLHAIANPRLRSNHVDALVDGAVASAQHCGARAIVPGDDEWPVQLADLAGIDDPQDPYTKPPVCLWVRGQLNLAESLTESVSIIGARACTPYGRVTATEFSFDLAEAGWTVVSGGAYGIDTAAHRGTIAGGGSTIAVLASGIDCPYPAGNAKLFAEIEQTGALISEWPPGSVPRRHRFLIRNRVIAAITKGIVVVEAALRSGARQTARRAWELDRPVLIVPGSVASPASVGVHQLARGPGAISLVTRASEVIEDLGRLGADLAPVLRTRDNERDRLDPLASRVIDAFPKKGAVTASHIAAEAGLSMSEVNRTLPRLVMDQFIVSDGTNYELGRHPARQADASSTADVP